MSGTLPTWMEHWFGLSHGSGMGLAWRLDFHWPWTLWPTVLGVAALVAAIAGIYLRESRQVGRVYRLALAAMRLIVVGLVLLLIAQVELFCQRIGLPFVVVIIDDTRSMTTVDSYDATVGKALEDRVAQALRTRRLSRWNIVRTLFAENDGQLLTDLSESHKLRFYYLSEMKEGRRGDVPGILEELKATEAKGDSTRLGAAIRGALDDLRGTAPVAVVLATDGINTEGPGLLDGAAYSRHKGVPLLLIGVGSGRPARDLKLSDLEVEDVVFVNDLVPFRFKLTAAGFAGKKLSVELRRERLAGGNATKKGGTEKSETEKGEVVGRIEVTVAADGRPQEIVLPHRPDQTGEFRYTIDVEPPSGEVPVNHQPLARSVRVREEKIRVLLVEGLPRFEYRFLRNLLSRDKTIELDVLLQGAEMDFSDPDRDPSDADRCTMLKTFPVRSEDLRTYDVAIFGDVNPSLLSPSALQNLADFVDHGDKGGALVLLAGPNFMPQAYRDTPMARLMPFDPARAPHPQAGAQRAGAQQAGRSEPNKLLADGFVVQPTEMGLASPPMQLGDAPEQSQAIWRKLSPLYWMTELSDLKPSARVLAEHPTRTGPDGKRLPLIILQYVGGGGKVLFHAVDETYRWRRRWGDLYFARYWIQTLRFLSRWKLAEGARRAEGECPARLSAGRHEYQSGDPVRLQVHFLDERTTPLDDDGVIVELEQVGRQTQKVQLHRMETGRGYFEAVLDNLPAGDYHAKMISPTLAALPDRKKPTPESGDKEARNIASTLPADNFRVDPPQTEMARVEMDAAEMRQAADMTRGHYYTSQDVSRLIDDLPAGRPVPIETLPSLPLWNRWPVLALILGLLIGEWWLRKRRGMV